ncbi:MAG: malto-oligosyltrehalose synthase [Bacteroidales bacterium]|nr:malto-oligosyltrehalose synthase [Bacteroidales bacterium]
MTYNPVSSYRIQFSQFFTFRDLDKIIPYLHGLGVRTIYASPFFGAVPGSEHGYDVTDPLTINPEIGTLEEFRRIHHKLRLSGMGWIQDIVPNHMAFSVFNPWIVDILENGRMSEYSDYFDIDWHHPDEGLYGKVMLPFLDKQPDELIRSGEISIAFNKNRFVLKIRDSEYPAGYDSYPYILRNAKEKRVSCNLTDLIGLFNNTRNDRDAGEKGKTLQAERYVSDKIFRDHIDNRIKAINSNRDYLKELIRLQHYVPVCWRESEKLLNYRRFFTVNGLICLRMDRVHVFDAYHSFIKRLCTENLVQGLRVDHIDGLYDPEEYLFRLRELAGREKYIVAEKILERNEHLENIWPIQGETGYYFLALTNNLLTCKKNFKPIEKAYKGWKTGESGDFDEVLYRKKHFILFKQMSGDLDNLFRCFQSFSIKDLSFYDPARIKAAIGEFILSCPVYRINIVREDYSSQGINTLNRTFEIAMKRSPDLREELNLLKKLFLKRRGSAVKKSEGINDFFRRCMQITGPLMAKGAEDTAYYTFNRFIVHNEVGDSPGYFGINVVDFHNEMIKRQKHFPMSLNATSTHDTKRGEDARARLQVLSDLPKLWKEKTEYWRSINRRFKKIRKNREIPGPNDEYFIYQTIIGFMPLGKLPDDGFESRLGNYLRKALREGKVESDWSDPDIVYEEGCISFIHSILSDGSEFMKSLVPFLSKLSYPGIINSLSQTVLKFTAPGVPDIYQGSESWNFSFVDPDNRRAVDFRSLANRCDILIKGKQEIRDLFSDPYNPDLKILLTRVLLKLRNDYPDVFLKGEYIPLKVKGKLRRMVVAYARQYDKTTIIIVVPLHPGILFDNRDSAGLEAIDWKDTRIEIPDLFPDEYEDILTDRSPGFVNNFLLSKLFFHLPFCLLKGDSKVTDRKAGILMHITSLPGRYPVGDLGPEAYNFADFLRRSGQSYWQILPLNQVYDQGGYSPYSPLSAFAGNICLISPELLAEQNMICELPGKFLPGPSVRVNYRSAERIKEKAIRTAFKNLKKSNSSFFINDFAEFREQENYWLRDYSLFVALRRKFNNLPWNKWPEVFRDREKETLNQFLQDNFEEIEREEFSQFLFLQQWKSLKNYCNDRSIRIFGDMPIYINYDSADVWAHPEFFKLKKNKDMKAVAGVPPDYFSESGQLWNLPVFRWDVMRNEGFTWWKKRLRKNLELFDLLRLDHFRGFSAFWEVPAGEVTAIKGKWVKGPGYGLFDQIMKEFPSMPFVAEDLGHIDRTVYQLRDKYGLPGMRVLQFAFGTDSANSVHILHNHTENSIVYTGTHDNNTIRGWFVDEAGPLNRKNLNNYSGKKAGSSDCHWLLIRLAYSSVAKIAIIPMQDILGLDLTARMNTPSVEAGNWVWRLGGKDLNTTIEKKLIGLVKTFGRR